jgi:hypothetical protein
LKLKGPAQALDKALTLHTIKVAAKIGETLALQAGQITEKTQSGQSLGSLEKYASDWNSTDLCEVTSGLSKDWEPIADPRGPMPIAQQLLRFKKAMHEHDMAWYDVDKNITVNSYSTCL